MARKATRHRPEEMSGAEAQAEQVERSKFRVIHVDEDTLRKVVRDEIRDGLKSLGIDPDDVLENQKDFAWLRTWRKAIVTGGARGMLAAYTILVIGALGAFLMWLGVPSSWIHGAH